MLRAGRDPAQASFGLVLLHGRGAGARDILGFAEALALPDLAFIAPEAKGLSWWPTSFLAPTMQMAPYVDAGLSQVASAVETFKHAGLAPAQIGVLGFSQGGCLALEYLAREGEGIGFGVALSAGLVGTGDIDGTSEPTLYDHQDKMFDYQGDLSGLTLYASCHTSDPHIPLKRFEDSVGVMAGLGASVDHRIKPGQGHGIDTEDVARVRQLFNVSLG